MRTQDKLNTLMLLCGISSIRLSRALNVDASLVSRWRSGARRPKAEYWAPLAAWFAEHATEEYQRQALATLLGCDEELPGADTARFAEAIRRWLTEEEAAFPAGLSSLVSLASEDTAPSSEPLARGGDGARLYSGASGIYEALAALLQLLREREYQGEVYLFLDDPPDWLNAEDIFIHQAVTRIFQLRQDIHLVCLLPRVCRAPDMIRYMENILVLCRYANAQIYQYAAYKPGSFPQWLAVAPGLAAVANLGLGSGGGVLTTETAAVRSLGERFQGLLGQSQPLFRALGCQQALDVINSAALRCQQPGVVYSLCSALPQITMPPQLLADTIERSSLPTEQKQAMQEAALARNRAFLRHLETERHFMAIAPAAKKTVLAGEASVCHSLLCFGAPLYYTPVGYADHLRYLLRLLERYPNLELCCSERLWPNMLLSATTGVSGVLHRTASPAQTLFSLNNELSEQFFLYLENAYEKLPAQERNRFATVKRLRTLAEEIEASGRG